VYVSTSYRNHISKKAPLNHPAHLPASAGSSHTCKFQCFNTTWQPVWMTLQGFFSSLHPLLTFIPLLAVTILKYHKSVFLQPNFLSNGWL